MSGCFMCSPVPCGALMKLLLCTHTYIHTYIHTTQRPSKQGRLGPLRGADSFLGKWEPAGFDKHTHTHAHTNTHQTASCAWTQHFPAMFIYSMHSRSLLYLSSLSCPLASHTLRLQFTFPLHSSQINSFTYLA